MDIVHKLDELTEKINLSLDESKTTLPSDSAKLDNQVKNAVRRMAKMREYLHLALAAVLAAHKVITIEQIPQFHLPVNLEELVQLSGMYGDALVDCDAALSTLYHHASFRLFEIMSRIHPMLIYHVIDDAKYAEAVLDCNEGMPLFKELIFSIGEVARAKYQVTPETETCEIGA